MVGGVSPAPRAIRLPSGPSTSDRDEVIGAIPGIIASRGATVAGSAGGTAIVVFLV